MNLAELYAEADKHGVTILNDKPLRLGLFANKNCDTIYIVEESDATCVAYFNINTPFANDDGSYRLTSGDIEHSNFNKMIATGVIVPVSQAMLKKAISKPTMTQAPAAVDDLTSEELRRFQTGYYTRILGVIGDEPRKVNRIRRMVEDQVGETPAGIISKQLQTLRKHGLVEEVGSSERNKTYKITRRGVKACEKLIREK